MDVIACAVPPDSALGPDAIADAWFRDAYRAPLTRPELGIVEIYAAVFGHMPLYAKLLLIARNAGARLAGLTTPLLSSILHPDIGGDYAVGDQIGPWPVFAIDANEIVAGRDNPHLDFRVSVLRRDSAEGPTVTVSTICQVHNLAGKIYLLFVIPFHRFGVRMLVRNAVAAGRL